MNSYILNHKSLNTISQEWTNKINFQGILDNIPIPITLWKLCGEDFFLVYTNRIAGEIIEPKISLGVQLSKALPEEYKRIFHPTPSESINNSSSQVMIDKDFLLIFNKLSLKENQINDENKYEDGSFKSIVEQSPISIIVTDNLGNIKYVNPNFAKVTGYSMEELIGKNLRLLKSGETPVEEYKTLWNTILSGNVWNGEFINSRKNGEHYNGWTIVSPVNDNKNRISSFIVIKEDITKLKKANEELKKYERLASIGKIAAYISHEIKTPLTSIKINVDLLEKNNLIDANSKKSLSIIKKEIKRLTILLKNILQFSNQSNLHLIDINLYKKIENIKIFMQPLLEKKGVTLLNNTLQHNILGDPQQLHSLFLLLIENSIEAMNNGGEIEIFSELKNNHCHIYIKDNGYGFNSTENIFEPFVTTKSSGTGLGLAIAKNIIDRHQGSIRLVSSRKGETTFEIILPASVKGNGKVTNN